MFEILDQISYKLNFSYIVREPGDGQWGIRSGNSWSGMIRQLVDKEVVVAAAAFAISHDRRQAVNFSSALDLQPYAFMYRRPKEVSRMFLFIKPFAPLVWIGIVVMAILMGPILYVVHRSSLYYKYHDQVRRIYVSL